MAKRKIKLFDKKGRKRCSGCLQYKELFHYRPSAQDKPGYCDMCAAECNRRHRARKAIEYHRAFLIKKEKDPVETIREHFNKAYEAATLHQDYKQYLVDSFAATDDYLLTRAKDNQYSINQYSNLNYGRRP